jgi:hypothetical protein
MSGAVLLGPGLAGMLVNPNVPQTDNAVAANYEAFDGLMPLDNPAADQGDSGAVTGGAQYGWNEPGHSPRPGATDQPEGQVYTKGPLSATVGTLGGQPLPVSNRIYKGTGDYTRSRTPSIQQRLGIGQHGPSELGVAQTVQLSEITNAPPQPGDLTSILAGLG